LSSYDKTYQPVWESEHSPRLTGRCVHDDLFICTVYQGYIIYCSLPGKKCKTIRRLAFEEKLTPEEISLLQGIFYIVIISDLSVARLIHEIFSGLNFRFNSMEEVYEEADFDECLARLVQYEKENESGYQIPKKYKPDPEL
jgi:hypothetical protein